MTALAEGHPGGKGSTVWSSVTADDKLGRGAGCAFHCKMLPPLFHHADVGGYVSSLRHSCVTLVSGFNEAVVDITRSEMRILRPLLLVICPVLAEHDVQELTIKPSAHRPLHWRHRFKGGYAVFHNVAWEDGAIGFASKDDQVPQPRITDCASSTSLCLA